MLKSIPKLSKNQLKNHQKMMRGNIKQILTQIHQTLRFWLPSWTHLREPFLGYRVCFRPVFPNLWGDPWPDVGLPCGTFGPIFLTFWKISGAMLLPNSKIPKQQMAPTARSKKQARIQNYFTNINPNKSSFTSIV